MAANEVTGAFCPGKADGFRVGIDDPAVPVDNNGKGGKVNEGTVFLLALFKGLQWSGCVPRQAGSCGQARQTGLPASPPFWR